MGQCCAQAKPPSDSFKDITIDNVHTSNTKVFRRAVTENVFTNFKIKRINKNSFGNCEKALKIINQKVFGKTKSSQNMIQILKTSTHSSSNNLGKINFSRFHSKVGPIESHKEKADVIEEEEDDENEKVKSPLKDKELTPDEQDKIYQILVSNFVFEGFNDEIIKFIMSELIQLEIENGKFIYEKGFDKDFFYIIAKGKVNIIGKNNKIVKTYGQWESFGHTSLFCNMTNQKMKYSAQCEGDVVLYVLDGESFQNIQKELIKGRLEEQFNFIKKIPIFDSLNNIEKYNIAEKITIMEYNVGDKIIDEDNPKDNETMFLIKSGSVKIEKHNKSLKTLGENEYFGVEKILLDSSYPIESHLTVRAIEVTVCYKLYKKDLIEAFGIGYKDILLFSIFKWCILHHTFFKDIFSEKYICSIFNSFKLHFYKAGESLYSDKRSNKRIIVVIEGNVSDSESKTFVASRGGVIGKEVIMKNEEISKNLVAYPNLISLESDLSNFTKTFSVEHTFKRTITIMKRNNKLKKIPIFKYLSERLLSSISRTMTKEKFKPNDVIIEEGTRGSTFYLIKKGTVKIVKKGIFIREIGQGSCFGEMALLQDNVSGDIRTASVVAVTDVSCVVLSKENFDLIIKNKLIKKYITDKIACQDTNIQLGDLYFIKALGKGRFGNVLLVHNNKNYYGLKSVAVKRAIRDKMTTYLISERNIMQLLDHPFIIKLVKTLKDENFCYFLLEYVNGQSLDDYLTKRCLYRQINEIKFYCAILLLILDYLQQKSVVHRDIKPSNIMIDKNGYLKLIDFGCAKVVTDYTSTVLGTPQYIAPEMLKGKGYSMSCDFWSVGIVAYEIYYGKCPFGNNCGNDTMAIYKSILYDEVRYSNSQNAANVDEFIKSLLEKQVNKRNCSVNTLRKLSLFNIDNSDNIKKSQKNVNKEEEKDYFDMIMDYEIKAPYQPFIKERKISKPEEDSKQLFVNYGKKIMIDEISTINSSNGKDNSTDIIDSKWLDDF